MAAAPPRAGLPSFCIGGAGGGCVGHLLGVRAGWWSCPWPNLQHSDPLCSLPVIFLGILQLRTGSCDQESRSLRAFSDCQCISSPLWLETSWLSLYCLIVPCRLSLSLAAPAACSSWLCVSQSRSITQTAPKWPLKYNEDFKMHGFRMLIT